MEARCVWDAEVGGSSPPTPTNNLRIYPSFYLAGVGVFPCGDFAALNKLAHPDQ
jgi:hypothetical protein